MTKNRVKFAPQTEVHPRGPGGGGTALVGGTVSVGRRVTGAGVGGTVSVGRGAGVAVSIGRTGVGVAAGPHAANDMTQMALIAMQLTNLKWICDLMVDLH